MVWCGVIQCGVSGHWAPFSACSMICRRAFFRLLALSMSCSRLLKGRGTAGPSPGESPDEELAPSSPSERGDTEPMGTSWASASSLRAFTRESSFSFSMAHWRGQEGETSLNMAHWRGREGGRDQFKHGTAEREGERPV